jgi:hypothetical protein
MIKSILQLQENTDITAINNEREIGEDNTCGQVKLQN